MASFPNLKTGAVAQYPAKRSLVFQNDALRFVDGMEQRYRDSAGPLHRWEISLDRLDEGEVAAVMEFFLAAQGAYEEFSFTDPWDSTVYSNCSLESDALDSYGKARSMGNDVDRDRGEPEITMLVYPQLASGAISQFPVQKRVTLRTIINLASDSSAIRAADPAAAMTEWALNYSDLSDAEAGTLEQFFVSAEGSLNGFTFLDPAGNLFASSDQLDVAVWEKDPLLAPTDGFDDPRGGKLAWQLQNSGAGSQTLSPNIGGARWVSLLPERLRDGAPKDHRDAHRRKPVRGPGRHRAMEPDRVHNHSGCAALRHRDSSRRERNGLRDAGRTAAIAIRISVHDGQRGV